MEKRRVKVNINRFNPETDQVPYMQEFYVDIEPGATVLSVLKDIYENQDHSLAFYYSCRIGKCTGCQVKVNGKVRFACTELVTGDVVLEPQPGYKVVRDLFVDKHQKQ